MKNGSLTLLKDDQNFNESDTVIPVHAGELTHMVLSSDGKYLFTGGSDGNIFIFGVKNFNKFGFVSE
jgi:WD40 repeat protein